ncbi:DUF4269 domain-containing protein [Paenibacillus wynnii]|uniref:DUF4269 domain-containing protein n=1 Tax=Paenibacillus wynnii TaxID=268407 RepID=UPI00278F8DEA|nr:DUF4269 domain-containing protein [Paenibacillus wynnii]MDQ0194594.1 hypothetical protein [Paenibacillus wynnii]
MKTMKTEEKFLDITYLSQGNKVQRESHRTLTNLNIFSILKDYDPILVGTIPIDVDIQGSDLDIICEVYDFNKFEEVLSNYFRGFDNFHYAYKIINHTPRGVCSFTYNRSILEIFGQPIPSSKQNGYRHMIIEYRILNLLGRNGHELIRNLKKAGYKTEPAFGELLNLNGDPYERLLTMHDWNDETLKEYLWVNSIDVV